MKPGVWNRPLLITLVLLAVAFGSACADDGSKEDGGASDATAPAATTADVPDEGTLVRAVEGEGDPRDAWTFEPLEITVVTGTEIAFTNDGNEVHTATADDGSFDTGTLNAGDSGTVVFEEAGSFAYHCSLHPWMKGQVVVTPAT